MRFFLVFIFVYSFSSTANAGFGRWSTDIESNPFSGGKDVNVLYIVSRSAQVQVRCDSSDVGIEFIAIPGFELSADISGKLVDSKLAVDGNVIISEAVGYTSAFGANLAGVVIKLDSEKSKSIVEAMINAKRQVAISDGLASKPFLLTARGSTKAGKALNECIKVQKGDQEDIADEAEINKAAKIEEIKKQISELESELKELEAAKN